jgi:PKHD-type hydroxylase
MDYKSQYLNLYEFNSNEWGEKSITETYSFSDAFTDEEIEKIIELCLKYPTEDGEIGADDEKNVNDGVRSSIIRWIRVNEETKFIYDRITEMIKEANEVMWGFDLSGYYEPLQFTEYYGNDEGHYDWHLDVGPGIDYRKISITIQLSDEDEYDGGELQFLVGPEKMMQTVPKQKGLVSIFPSYLLHRVKNVNKGVRRSLVLWVSGPPFR